MNIHSFRTLVPTAALLLAAGSAPALSPSLPYRVRLPDLPAGQPARLLFTLRVPEGTATNTVWSGLATVVPASDGTVGVLLDDTLRADPAGPTLEDAFRRADGAPLLLAVTDPETALPHGPEQTLIPVPLAHVAGEASRSDASFAVVGDLEAGEAKIETSGSGPGRLTVDGDSTIEWFSADQLDVAGDATFTGPVEFKGGVHVEGEVETEIDGVGAVPVGTILFWTKTELPEGPEGTWAWCNGENNTPDLRGLFLRGASDTLAPGTTGGHETVSLTQNHIPAHSHSYSYTVPANNNAGYSAKLQSGWKVWRKTNTQTLESEPAGAGVPHENMPAYLRLAFIMRIR